jgi:PAS domain S-box-containing protein
MCPLIFDKPKLHSDKLDIDIPNSSLIRVKKFKSVKKELQYKNSIHQLIDELVATEDELTNIRQILSASSDPILITNPKVEIIYVNPAWEKLTGYKFEEIIGQNPKFLQSGKTPKEVYERMWNALVKNLSFNSDEIIDKHKDGHEYQVYSAFFPVLKSGQVIYFVQLQHDITKQKQLEGLKRSFLSMAAHELKTPVTTLKLLSQLHLAQFKKSGKDTISEEELELIDNELGRLTSLINDILDDQRLESGRMNLQLQQINLTQLINNIFHKLKSVTKNHKVATSLSPNIEVIADPNRLDQVITNLLINAVKYSLEGSKITIKLQIRGNKALFSIKDQGQGIPKGKQKLIFDRFYQINNLSGSGFGLGLYISKEIINLHKGKIWVESDFGKGSIFYFSLPLTDFEGVKT